MFLQDVLRHVGAARAAEFVGGTDANIAMDQAQLRSAYYTPKEAMDQLSIAPENGAEGTAPARRRRCLPRRHQRGAGAMCPLGSPTGPSCPAEYLALQKKPSPGTAPT